MRPTIATAVLGGLIGAVIAVGVMLWEPWNSGDSDPLLTGGEAAANVEARWREFPDVVVSCDAEDFNARTGNWIVKCTFGSERRVTQRFSVADRTGKVLTTELEELATPRPTPRPLRTIPPQQR